MIVPEIIPFPVNFVKSGGEAAKRFAARGWGLGTGGWLKVPLRGVKIEWCAAPCTYPVHAAYYNNSMARSAFILQLTA